MYEFMVVCRGVGNGYQKVAAASIVRENEQRSQVYDLKHL